MTLGPEDFRLKENKNNKKLNDQIKEITNFIKDLQIQILPDIILNIPDEEKTISFSAEDLEKIKKD